MELLGPRVYFCSTSRAELFSELAALFHILPPGFTDEELETQRLSHLGLKYQTQDRLGFL